MQTLLHHFYIGYNLHRNINRGWISLGSRTRIIRNPKSPHPQNPEISPSKIQISEIKNPPKNEKSRNPESRIQPPATRIRNHEI
jgi:hypothetical protein